MNAAEPLRAPAGAQGWSPHIGWLYSADELAERADGDAYVLTVSGDGLLRGVTANDNAPLVALLRVEVDVTEIVQRVDDLADTVAGLDALTRRVAALEGGAP